MLNIFGFESVMIMLKNEQKQPKKRIQENKMTKSFNTHQNTYNFNYNQF